MAGELDIVRAGLDELPLFPLPEGVLLPYELLPLHVFEPRYREMIADVLARGRPLAIAQLAPGWEEKYEERPAVEPVFGVGLVTRSESLPDGRYNILVKGVLRVRLVRELPPRRAYREVQVVELRDKQVDARSLDERAGSLRRMLFALCSTRPGPAANALAQLAARASSPGSLADIVAAALFTDYAVRRQALESLDPIVRLDLAQTAVAELLIDAGDGDAFSPLFRN